VNPKSTAALGLDLGSTRIKAGLLGFDGAFRSLKSCESPPLHRDGPVCEGDSDAYVDAACSLLKALADDEVDGLAAGLSCQRSSFVLHDRGGRAVTPMISWQDTRAADWCRRHHDLQDEFHQRTGLMLSAHYVGPKLAALAEDDPALRRGLRCGDLRLRLLDCLILQRLGGAPTTDPSMAARTGLFDIETLRWSTTLCTTFGVDPRCLPAVRASDDLEIRTAHGAVFRSSLADQSAGLVGLTGGGEDTLLVNLGTGGFVLRPVGERPVRLGGYLTGILRAERDGAPLYALEGAISGCGPAIDRFRTTDMVLERADPVADLFALPDGAGLGAPHWRPEIGALFSRPESSIDRVGAYRAMLEGLLFRVREIYDDLDAGGRPQRVVLAGGLSNEPFVAQGLATLLDVAVERIDAAEATLRGAALAASPGLRGVPLASTRFEPSDCGAYLREKYGRWRDWLKDLLA
jgi:glycerol kinase